jgi:hypothetical protein
METPRQASRFLLLLGLCVLALFITVPVSEVLIRVLGDYRVVVEHEMVFGFAVYVFVCGLLYIGLVKIRKMVGK